MAVQDNGVQPLGLDVGQPLTGGPCRYHLQVAVSQGGFQRVQDVWFVVDDQEAGHGSGPPTAT